MKREWGATRDNYIISDRKPNVPQPPDGDGWRLVAAVTCSNSYNTGPVWYWEREVPDDAKKAEKAAEKGNV